MSLLEYKPSNFRLMTDNMSIRKQILSIWISHAVMEKIMEKQE